jgi:acetyl/propionyl-CoA carboxylase alpha subunit
VFETVLVADRGVTGARVVRACGQVGAQAVAVHGDHDARAPHVRLADDAVPLGGRAFSETYGDTRKVLEAARRSGAQALHPGASPLALDPVFARSVTDAGLVWLGPPPEALEQRPTAPPAGRRLGVVVRVDHARPSVVGARARWGELLDEHVPADAASREALSAAGEVAGRAGPGLWALDVVLAADGPVVVGHLPVPAAGSTVTSLATGVGLVELQLRLAAGDDPPAGGSGAPAALALQVRAAERFAGRLRRFRAPQLDGVRVDVGTAEGARVTSESTPLLAAITVEGADRDEALARARHAVAEFEVAGVPTTLTVLSAVLDDPSFAAGEPDPPLLERISRS